MPTEKPRITFTLDEETLKAVDEYRFKYKKKNQSQAILSLIDLGMESLLSEMEENKKAPKLEGSEALIPLDTTNEFLVEMGYIRPGEDLSDADLAFLTHIGGLMDAWFSSKDS